MYKKLTVLLTLGLVLAAPAFAAADLTVAKQGLNDLLLSVGLIGGALLAMSLAIFPVRWIASFFR